jgi:endonuclease/exonuclease/phosphatase family metal-dependent hydrolase
MSLKEISSILLFLFSTAIYAQDQPIGIVAFYNVENLFDTKDDPTINDEEYMPTGKKEWNEVKYQNKLTNMAKVLSSMPYRPDIIGLAEVENRVVLEDLIAMPTVAEEKYQIVHFDSPDFRGIDVALLYRSEKFQPLSAIKIPFTHDTNANFKTRDMLWVKGLYEGDTLNVVVTHWPSRRGGKQAERIMAATILRKHIDSVQSINPAAKIILMGDFNDDPTDNSIKMVLRADNKESKLKNGNMYNASLKTFEEGFGTLMYKGVWNLFDQIIISQSLIKGNKNASTYFYSPDSFSIYKPEWMREPGKPEPQRTFSYGVYKNGFSDHYPSLIVLAK